jgi:hypothetical protein
MRHRELRETRRREKRRDGKKGGGDSIKYRLVGPGHGAAHSILLLPPFPFFPFFLCCINTTTSPPPSSGTQGCCWTRPPKSYSIVSGSAGAQPHTHTHTPWAVCLLLYILRRSLVSRLYTTSRVLIRPTLI